MVTLTFTVDEATGEYVSQSLSNSPAALYIKFEEDGGKFKIESSNGEEGVWDYADEQSAGAAGDYQRYCVTGLVSGEKWRVRCNMQPSYAKVI